MSGIKKSTVVLVHGAFQTANAWSRVTPKLAADEVSVVTVNLPGRDADGTDPDKLTTEYYQQAVLQAISAETSPVLLVGHSFGGITISNVAEAAPEKIAALVYLSAFLPKDGESLQSLAQTDADSGLGKDGNFVVSADYAYASIKPENAADIFGNDATPADREAIGQSLIREPLTPMAIPVKLTFARFGRVPKYYIETSEDRIVSPSLQTRMVANGGVRRVFKINAGHASYMTRPAEVAQAILAIAAEANEPQSASA
jgi:pimeloyl-ACP methyl ester carboxylesterase